MTTLRMLLPCLAALITFSFTACRPQKNLNYFSADKRDSSHMRIWQDYQAKIQPGDRLTIAVTALNPESARPYSITSTNTSPGVASGQSSAGITVEPNGSILYPQLGWIKAAGLTTYALRDTLLKRLRNYVTDPIVTVDFANYKVTVLGEVNKQGPIMEPDGNLTILEALGQAGDVTLSAQRDSIIVIREVDGKREFGYINLLSNEMFKSHYFLLHQNDIVIVPMNKSKVSQISEQGSFLQRSLTIVSILTSITTLGWLILNITN